MNIIYIHTHDSGRYIQPYGYGFASPNLQQLAVSGTLFRQAFCTAPTCSPSRAGLLTGTMPHENGMWGLAHRGFSLRQTQQHLAAYLSAKGYQTVLCGIQHEGEDARALGYEKILGDQNYSMGKCQKDWYAFDIGNAREAGAYIKQKKAKPYFLSMGLFNTHRVYPELTESSQPQYVQVPPQIYDNEENRRDMAAYGESLKAADEAVGIIMDALHSSGQEEDTLVLFTTDHGLALPTMKCTLYDTGIGVSLIIKYKGNCLAGKATDALVSHLDIFPTLCDIAGIEPPEWLRGISLRPLLEEKTDSVRTEIFAESSFHVAYEPMRCIRTQRYKYIRRYSQYLKGMPSNTDDSPDKELRLASGYYEQPYPENALFDLYNDPLERVNLADNLNYQDILIDMEERLLQWMAETKDPLLAGIMIPPENALVNYPASLSAAEKVFIKDFSQLV